MAKHATEPVFAEEAWDKNRAIYTAMLEMPFNAELLAGSLSRERFKHYLIQDEHYLKFFAQAAAVGVSKAEDAEHAREFLHLAQWFVPNEDDLHWHYLRAYGISKQGLADSTTASPACHHYGSFLLATAYREPLPVLAAAMLPCPWVYLEVGRHMNGKLKEKGVERRDNNPYARWMEFYASEEYAANVHSYLEMVNSLAISASPSLRRKMQQAFGYAMRLEHQFWESAYRLESWIGE